VLNVALINDIQIQPALLIKMKMKKTKLFRLLFSYSHSPPLPTPPPPPPPLLILILFLLHPLRGTDTQDCFNFTNKFHFSKILLSIQYIVEAALSFFLVTQILYSIYIYLLYHTLTLFAFVSIYCHSKYVSGWSSNWLYLALINVT